MEALIATRQVVSAHCAQRLLWRPSIPPLWRPPCSCQWTYIYIYIIYIYVCVYI